MVMSGPAAGVAAAQALLRSLTIADAVTFDMGGTSTDVCLIAGGLAQTVRERSINGWKVRLPSVAVESIGAGGGSVAWLDSAGALKVGPRSAGARPGPAAYAQGGAEPTVTDANVALGLIRPGLEFGGGAIRIDADLARRAMVQVAEPLGLGLLEAAAGLVEVANAGMLRAIRLVSVQRGIDPRDLALVAYGGAGPLHAARLAQALGIPRVVVPAYASTFSALGCLASELRYDLVQTYRRALAELESAELAQQLARLEAAAAEPLRRDGHAAGEITTRQSLDLRYTGQNYELEVPLEPGPGGLDRGVIRERFLEQHRRLYSYATDEPVECTALRVVAFVPGAVPKLPERRPRGPGLVEAAYRCWMPGYEEVAAMVYRRAGLGLDESITGPALVEDEQSTTVVLPGMRAWADRFGNLHLERAP
jgi:N-methylhydantoinase A